MSFAELHTGGPNGPVYSLLSVEASEEVNAGFSFRAEAVGVCPNELKLPLADFYLNVNGVLYAGKVNGLQLNKHSFVVEGKDLFSATASRTYIDAHNITKQTAAAILSSVDVTGGPLFQVHFATDEGNQTVFSFVRSLTDMLGRDFRTNPNSYGAEVCISGAAGLGRSVNIDSEVKDYELFKDFAELYSYVILCKVCPMDVKKEKHVKFERAVYDSASGTNIDLYLAPEIPAELLAEKYPGEVLAHTDTYSEENSNYSVSIFGEDPFTVEASTSPVPRPHWADNCYIPKAEYVKNEYGNQTYLHQQESQVITLYKPCHGENPLGPVGKRVITYDFTATHHSTISHLYALGSDIEKAFIERAIIAKKIENTSSRLEFSDDSFDYSDYENQFGYTNHSRHTENESELSRNDCRHIDYYNSNGVGHGGNVGPRIQTDILYCNPYGHDYTARRVQTWGVIVVHSSSVSYVEWQDNIGPDNFPWFHLTREIEDFTTASFGSVDKVNYIRYSEARLNKHFDPLRQTDVEIADGGNSNQPKGYHLPTVWKVNCQFPRTVYETDFAVALAEKSQWRTARMVVRKGRSRDSKYFNINQFEALTADDIFIEGDYADEYGVTAQVKGVSLACCPMDYDPSFRIAVEDSGNVAARKGYCITSSFWAHKEEARSLGALYLQRINRSKLTVSLKTALRNDLRIGDRFTFKGLNFTILSLKHTLNSSKIETEIGACAY